MCKKMYALYASCKEFSQDYGAYLIRYTSPIYDKLGQARSDEYEFTAELIPSKNIDFIHIERLLLHYIPGFRLDRTFGREEVAAFAEALFYQLHAIWKYPISNRSKRRLVVHAIHATFSEIAWEVFNLACPQVKKMHHINGVGINDAGVVSYHYKAHVPTPYLDGIWMMKTFEISPSSEWQEKELREFCEHCLGWNKEQAFALIENEKKTRSLHRLIYLQGLHHMERTVSASSEGVSITQEFSLRA